MLHERRVFQEPSEVATEEELAEKLTQHTWTLCAAFKIRDLLFLNDSLSEDGAAEFAVVRGDRQIESITFGWCTEEQAREYIRRLLKGDLVSPVGRVAPRYHPRGTCCDLCR